MLVLGTVRRGYSAGTSAPPGKGRPGGDRPCAGPVAKVGQPSPKFAHSGKISQEGRPLAPPPPSVLKIKNSVGFADQVRSRFGTAHCKMPLA